MNDIERLQNIINELRKDDEEGHGSSYELQWKDIYTIENLLQGNLFEMYKYYKDLYNKEKEKNKALKEGLKYRVNYCKLLEKELYANGVNYEFEKTEIEKQFLEEGE